MNLETPRTARSSARGKWRRGRAAWIGAAALLSLPLALPALAQDNGPPPDGFGGGPGQPPPDGFGGGNGQAPDGFGGGNGMAGADSTAGVPGMTDATDAARPQWLSGTVSAIDTAAQTITLTTRGGTSRTVKVAADTQMTALQTASVADLKLGDAVSVRGVPTGITASQLTDGPTPAGLPGGGGPRPGPASPQSAGQTSGTEADPAQAFAMASGTIKALPTKTDPHLALALGSDTVLYLKVSDGTKVMRYATLTLKDVKAGDQIMAAARTEADGSLTATSLGVNLPGFGPGDRPAGPGGVGAVPAALVR